METQEKPKKQRVSKAKTLKISNIEAELMQRIITDAIYSSWKFGENAHHHAHEATEKIKKMLNS